MSTAQSIVALIQGRSTIHGNATNLNAIQSALIPPSNSDSALGQDPAVANYWENLTNQATFVNRAGQPGSSLIQSTPMHWTDKNGKVHDLGPYYFAESVSGRTTRVVSWYGVLSETLLKQLDTDLLDLPEDAEITIAGYKHDYPKLKVKDLILKHEEGNRKDTTTSTCPENPDCTTGVFCYDEQPYCVDGAVMSNVSYNDVPQWAMPTTIGALTLDTNAALSEITLQQYLIPLLDAATAGHTTMCSGIQYATGTSDAINALNETATAAENAGGAAAASEGVAMGITCAGAVCFGISFALIVGTVAIDALSHYSYNALEIVNLSDAYDLTWDFPYLWKGTEIAAGPILNDGNTMYEQLIKGKHSASITVQGHPNMTSDPVTVYGHETFGFASRGAEVGCGEAFTFNFYTINTNANTASDYDGDTPVGYGAFKIIVPWGSSNKIAATLSDDKLDPEQYWDSAGDQPTNYLSYYLPTLKLIITIKIDYLQGGNHLMPMNPTTGQTNEGYYYQVLVVIQDGDQTGTVA